VCIWHAGVSGNVLIDENADRRSSFHVWDYAEGHDSYYRSMLVDVTQPPGKVSDVLFSTLSEAHLHLACSECIENLCTFGLRT